METVNKKRIAKNTILLYIRMAFNMAVALYTSRALLRVLGVEDYGLYNVIGGVVVLFSFLNTSLAGASSRFITFNLGKNDPKELKRIFSAVLLCHVCIAVLIVFLAETVGLYFVLHKMVVPEGRMNVVLWVYQFSIAAAVCTMTQVPYNACIIAHERMNAFAYIGIGETVLKLLAVFGVLVFSDSDRLFVYAFLILCVVVGITICYRLYCKIHFKECSFHFVWDSNLYRTLLAYAGWDLIGNFSVIAQGQGLNVLLNVFFGPEVNAARAVSVQVQGALVQFSNNFMLAVRPQIIKSYACGKVDAMLDLVYQSAKYGYALTLFFVAPIFFEMDIILKLWLQNVPDFAVPFCRILLLVSLVNVLRNPFIAALHATGNIRLANFLCGSILVSTLPLSYLWLKLGGAPLSVFWITLFITFIVVWIDLLNLKRLLPISLVRHFVQIILPCTTISVVDGLVLYVLQCYTPPSFTRLASTILISSVILLIFSYALILEKETRKKLLNKLDSLYHARKNIK